MKKFNEKKERLIANCKFAIARALEIIPQKKDIRKAKQYACKKLSIIAKNFNDSYQVDRGFFFDQLKIVADQNALETGFLHVFSSIENQFENWLQGENRKKVIFDFYSDFFNERKKSLGQDQNEGKNVLLSVCDLNVDPDRFQYKISGIGQDGTGEELKGLSEYNDDLGGRLLCWYDKEQQKTFVVNGHHRFELAKRTHYKGLIPCKILAVKTAEEARAIGALANIAEGRGSAIDGAKFIRSSNIENIESYGVSLKGETARKSKILSDLSDRLFNCLIQETITEGRAIAIAENLKDKALQDILLVHLEKRERNSKVLADYLVAEMARGFSAAPVETKKEISLFGEEEISESLFMERSELIANIRRALNVEYSAYSVACSKSKGEKIAEKEIGIIDRGKAKTEKMETERKIKALDDKCYRQGELSEVLDKYSVMLKKEATIKGKKHVIETAIKEAISVL